MVLEAAFAAGQNPDIKDIRTTVVTTNRKSPACISTG